MKRLIITFAFFVGASMCAFAQVQLSSPANGAPQPSKEQIAQREASDKKMIEQTSERQTKDLQQRYGLNEEQYKKAYEANTEFMTKMIAIRNASRTAGAANRGPANQSETFAIMEARDAKLKTIMTPEQFAKYDAVRPKAPRSNQQMPNAAQMPNSATTPAAAPATK